MCYLACTETLSLTLRADVDRLLEWYGDASYAVHMDLKSHTGSTMTLGKGCPFSKSTKQTINTKRSTEAEVVAADDLMPQILLTNYFLDAQGYNCKDTILYQDKKVPFYLKKMVEQAVENAQNISTLGTSSSRIESKIMS